MRNSNKELVDLYLLKYKNGDINPVYQFGDEDHEYGSGGDNLMYIHLANNRKSEYSEIYKRSLKKGLLKENIYFAGYSCSYDEVLDEKYRNTDYAKGLPKVNDYYGAEKMKSMSEENIDKAIDSYDEDMKQYKEKYKSEYGSIPKSPSFTHMHVFDSLEEAKRYCPLGTGRFNKFNAINEQHLEVLVNKKDFHSKIRQDERKLKEERNPQSENPSL